MYNKCNTSLSKKDTFDPSHHATLHGGTGLYTGPNMHKEARPINKGGGSIHQNYTQNSYLLPPISSPNQGGDYPTVTAQAHLCMYVHLYTHK